MELCKEYKTLNSSVEKEMLCESFELDFQENLPQYLDDIEKIVKCSVKSVVTDYECSGSTVKIYGKSLISLTYLNSSGCLLSNIFEEEFSKSFSSNSGDNVKFAKISLNTKYSNFRLINQRRIDIHTSLKADICVFAESAEQCLCSCRDAFVKEYSPSTLRERCSGICSEEFDETFTISNSSAKIKNIVNTFSRCVVEEKKIIKGKMLVKLRIETSVLYESEDNTVEKSCYTFTLSKIIEVNDADENDNAFVRATVSGLYVKAKADSENRLCDIEIVGKVTFNYSIYSVCDDEFIVDSYMTRHEAELKRSQIKIKSSPIFYSDTKTAEITFEAEKNIVEILDLKTNVNYCRVEDSVLKLGIALSFLYYDDASQLSYYEKTSEYALTLNDNKLNGAGSAGIISFDYVIRNADSVTLRINFEYSAYLYMSENISFITDISAAEEKNNMNMPQLTLYFAQKNENVWDIAKKFSTAVSLIMEENDLTSQIIDAQKVLLVPGM